MDNGDDQLGQFRWGRGTRLLLLCLPTLLAVVAGFGVAERYARSSTHQIQASDVLAPGMMTYDDVLGWRLTADWSGTHQHHDFTVTYRVNALGFRADSPEPAAAKRPVCAVLGDSFVFGFGVNDEDTFVAILNRWSTAAGEGAFINFGVPGYSTDQETLLLERRIRQLSPDAVLLVVYLGNDIVDNARAYPVQATRAKPYFVLTGDQLDLRNTPVPKYPGPACDPRQELRHAVLGPEADNESMLGRMLSASALLAPVQERINGTGISTEQLATRMDPLLRLFETIVNRAAGDCAQAGIPLYMALLGGRSYVEAPHGVSAVYQAFLRDRILAWSRENKIPTIDIAGEMRSQYLEDHVACFFKYDGHFTVEGHRKIAAILREEYPRVAHPATKVFSSGMASRSAAL